MLLHHFWLSPGCRRVRLVLGEKKLAHRLKLEPTARRNREFLALNPAGTTPVLVVETDAVTGAVRRHPVVVSGAQVICEYLDETRDPAALLGRTAEARAETRRLVAWFDVKFDAEVIQPLVGEKFTKRFYNLGAPDAGGIRAGRKNLGAHLAYISWLMDRRSWLAGATLSLADLAAAAALSCLDYLGDVPWDRHLGARDWYARIKSRPSFRPLLQEAIPGIAPPPHYADLDF